MNIMDEDELSLCGIALVSFIKICEKAMKLM